VAARYPKVEITSRAQWRAWLVANHCRSEGIWLVTHKRRSAGPHVPYDDVVEEALCFGWIDSTVRTLDENRSEQLLTPRRARSKWSQSNKRRVERLTEAGLMASAGIAAVELAKQTGTWNALDAVDALIEPGDLVTALGQAGPAREHWDAFSPSARRAILGWILDAKRPETRARRVAETARLAADNVRANESRPPAVRKAQSLDR
jgi:uncharacterized protein YdeI (YjbR/CyaY-like superfamily)